MVRRGGAGAPVKRAIRTGYVAHIRGGDEAIPFETKSLNADFDKMEVALITAMNLRGAKVSHAKIGVKENSPHYYATVFGNESGQQYQVRIERDRGKDLPRGR